MQDSCSLNVKHCFVLRLGQRDALAFGYQNALPAAVVTQYDEIQGHARFDLLFWDAHHVWWDVLRVLY